jgi:rhamnogalacturonan endolyase
MNYKKPTLRFRLILLIGSLSINGIVSNAQDSRERYYNYPILTPNHAAKPKVEGWANERITEKINRGLIACQTEDGKVYIGWRLLDSDPEDIGFNVFRSVNGKKGQKINKNPIQKTTDFLDSKQTAKLVEYWICPVKNGKELEASEKISMIKTENVPFKTIKFQGEYSPDRIAVGDLNGDGKYDFVIKQPEGRVDPGVWRKSPTTFKLEAYLSDGTFLWQKDLGWNIELGIWYSPFIVYDFNGDGKAEVAVKTAPTDVDYRGEDGRVFNGPEYCSILNGLTGEEMDRVDWPGRNPRFGDYNRNNRNQMGMAYLDGKTPSLLVCRGTYRLMVVDVYQLRGNKLEKLWRWDGDEENPVVRSQGAHGMHTVDVDDDGRDEIVLGSAVLNDDGTLLYSTGMGHPDKCFVTDIDPNRPGMELFFANEVWHDSLGVSMVDAKTGEPIWNIGHHTQHVGDGMVADIIPEIPGLECFASEDSKAGLRDKYMFSAKGDIIGSNDDVPPCRDWIFWDADLLREYIAPSDKIAGTPSFQMRKNAIIKYKGDTLLTGIQGMVLMIADLYGDWREELVTSVPGELRIYSTSIPANDRRVCLMRDHLYRSDVVHRSMGYMQSPVTSYYLGVILKKD